MVKIRVIQCSKSDCPNPIFKYKDRDKHRKKYHQLTIERVIYQGSVVPLINRDPSTLKFPCPCGAAEHSRFSSTKIHLLCRQNPHPTDPDAYLDSDEECATSSTIKKSRMQPSLEDQIDLDVPEDAPDIPAFGPPSFQPSDTLLGTSSLLGPSTETGPTASIGGEQRAEQSRLGSARLHLQRCQDLRPADPIIDSDQLTTSSTITDLRMQPPLENETDAHDNTPSVPTFKLHDFPQSDMPGDIVSQPSPPSASALPSDSICMLPGRVVQTEPGAFIRGDERLVQPDPINDLGDWDSVDLSSADPRAWLRLRGIDVEPQLFLTICIDCQEVINYNHAFAHRRSQHCDNRGPYAELGSKESFTKALEALNAHAPHPIPTDPIPPIRILPVLTGYRCGVTGCQERKIYSSTKLVTEHRASSHTDIPARQCPSIQVPMQRLGRFRGTMKLIEVIPHPPRNDNLDDSLSDIIRHFQHTIADAPTSFQPTKNVRARSEFLAKTRWDTVLQGVDLKILREAVREPHEIREPHLVRLKDLARKYYHGIAAGLDYNLSTLVLRYIHSADPEKELKKLPFHKPEQSDTIDRDSDFVTLFTSFLIRTLKSPIPSYEIALHPETHQILLDLQDRLSCDSQDDAMAIFHRFMYTFLAKQSLKFLSNEWKDPFRLFLIAFHLQDDHGSFSRTPLIPPTIAKAQWAFRATCAREIQIRKAEFGDDCFAAYTKYVRPFLTEKTPTMFNILREQMTMISTLAHLCPGLPLFSWDMAMRNLSIDGQVLPMSKFIRAMHIVIDNVSGLLQKVFRGHDYQDILQFIDSRLDPLMPQDWFRDRPQCFTIGTSVFGEPDNGFEQYRYRLLRVMSNDPVFFIRIERELVAKIANIRQWFGDLDELVKLVFFAIISMWGGSARGTECDHLQYEIQHNSQRNLHILNGLLTIVTYYVKTRSQKGHGSMIARTVPWQLARLLLLVYGVVFPAACHLATYAFDQEAAVSYRSYMFVLSGKVMASDDFTKVIASQTSMLFDITMGLRRYRQTMASILTNLAKADFTEIDADDEDLQEIHYMFAHSPLMAARNYARQLTNALTEISHTSVASSQRVCLVYHTALQLLHPNTSKELRPPQISQHCETDVSRIIPQLTTAVESALQNSATKIQDQISNVFTGYAQGLGAQVLQRVAHINNVATPPTRNPTIVVHPGLLQLIRPLLPYDKFPSFTIPQQAEAIQSCTSDFHVLIVMPTGSGKSLAFFAAPLLMPTKMFIVITPLVALTNDMSRRLASTGIVGGKWKSSINPFMARLVLVSAHQAGTQEFFTWAKTNDARIQRLFIDEAHHIYTSDDYRSCFKLFDMLTELGKPITFLSATILPRSVPYLCERMKIDPSLLIRVRAPTSRPNLRIRVTKCEDFDSMLVTVKNLFNSIELSAEDRGLIFCTTVANCKVVSKMLGIDYYIARLKPIEEENVEERLRLESQWREGILPQHRWMVATLCFGQGIDFKRVRWVIHVEVRNMMSYSQEIGRAGRDGQLAFARTFYTRPPPLTDRVSPHDHEGVVAMIEYLESSRCRNLKLGTFDDVEHSCAALGGELCDCCEDISLIPISGLRQPLRLDLPREHIHLHKGVHSTNRDRSRSSGSMSTNSTGTPTAISVASNAKVIQDQRAKGLSELEVLRQLLDNISTLGCVDCWYSDAPVDRLKPPHTHADSNFFRACSATLKSQRFPVVRHWPFCYHCWVPFRAPCFHPPHKREGIADPERCPYSDYLPRLVNLIWHDEEKRTRLQRQLMGDKADFSRFRVFTNWLVEPESTADEIPRPHQWVLSYFRVYRSLDNASVRDCNYQN